MIQYKNSMEYNISDERFYIQVRDLTKTIANSYAEHFNWLDNKFFKALREKNNNTRGYSFAVDYANFIDFPYGSLFDTVGTYKLAGCVLLKNEPEEKKLCCLFVDPNYRGQKIASKLIENSFELLNTTKPLMTVSQQNLGMLQKLIDRYGFELTSVKESIYKPGVKEYYYNEGLAR